MIKSEFVSVYKITKVLIIIILFILFAETGLAMELEDNFFSDMLNPALDILQNTLLKAASIASIVIFSIMLGLGMIERSETKVFIRIIIAIAIGFNGADWILSLFGAGMLI